eukprot:scaffold795_cov375-Prasinococcus_capsulatus_cf.AAC.15
MIVYGLCAGPPPRRGRAPPMRGDPSALLAPTRPGPSSSSLLPPPSPPPRCPDMAATTTAASSAVRPPLGAARDLILPFGPPRAGRSGQVRPRAARIMGMIIVKMIMMTTDVE